MLTDEREIRQATNIPAAFDTFIPHCPVHRQFTGVESFKPFRKDALRITLARPSTQGPIGLHHAPIDGYRTIMFDGGEK